MCFPYKHFVAKTWIDLFAWSVSLWVLASLLFKAVRKYIDVMWSRTARNYFSCVFPVFLLGFFPAVVAGLRT